MYSHACSKNMDQPAEVANPARGQLKRETKNSMSPFAPENLVSRDGFRDPVPCKPAHRHTQAESDAYLRDSSRVPWSHPFIYLNRYEFIGPRNSVPTTFNAGTFNMPTSYQK